MIIFDKHFTFKNQIKKNKEKLVSRINILKTLANKFCKLSDKILIQIYNSLIYKSKCFKYRRKNK